MKKNFLNLKCLSRMKQWTLDDYSTFWPCWRSLKWIPNGVWDWDNIRWRFSWIFWFLARSSDLYYAGLHFLMCVWVLCNLYASLLTSSKAIRAHYRRPDLNWRKYLRFCKIQKFDDFIFSNFPPFYHSCQMTSFFTWKDVEIFSCWF